uniref:Uncharacterized protein n=1 Tax=Oryza glumipatula TaxID=40148 RepID=A0A0D9YH85_9ORYZ
MGVWWRRGWLRLLLHYAENPMRTRGAGSICCSSRLVLGDFQLGGFPHRIAALSDWCLSHIAFCFGGREEGIFASLSYFSLSIRSPGFITGMPVQFSCGLQLASLPHIASSFGGREGGIFAFVSYCSLRNDMEPSRFVRICPRKRPHGTW